MAYTKYAFSVSTINRLVFQQCNSAVVVLPARSSFANCISARCGSRALRMTSVVSSERAMSHPVEESGCMSGWMMGGKGNPFAGCRPKHCRAKLSQQPRTFTNGSSRVTGVQQISLVCWSQSEIRNTLYLWLIRRECVLNTNPNIFVKIHGIFFRAVSLDATPWVAHLQYIIIIERIHRYWIYM